ncbi:ATP-binding protein [Paenibacillus sp. JTLBN-2024]
MNKIQIPNGSLAEVATYSDQIVSQYRNNPLIEALPEIKSREVVIQSVASYPCFDPSERNTDNHFRFHMIQQLQNYFQPLPIHIDLEARISRLIRQGYIARNPLSPMYAMQMVQGHSDIKKAQITQSIYDSPSGLTIIGVSGVGKSSAVKRILSMIPQVICHSDYKGNQLSAYQINYLRLECPPDGSIRGLINHFFAEIDQLLGTDHLNRFGKNGKLSSASLISIVAQIARACNLGILCVDEIQNLSLAKSGGAEKMLSFFVSLSNSIGLPIIQIGTPRAMSLFSDLRIARRGSGQGDLVWLPMKKEEQSWKIFLDGMWDYQWVRNPTALSPELEDAMYEASCGITDIAVKIFLMSQIKAITSGTEELTPRIINDVAKDNLKLVQPMLDALRSGNAVKMGMYGDINTLPIEGFVVAEQSKLELGNMLKNFQNVHQEQAMNRERMKQDAVVRLALLGIDDKEAHELIKRIFEEKPHLQSVKEIVQEVYKCHIGATEHSLPTSAKEVDKNDLRIVVEEGKENGLSAHQNLSNAGIIVTDFEV